MPTDEHQSIAAWLYKLLDAFAVANGGKVLFAPLRLRIREGKFREPDLILIRDADDTRRQNRFWLGADLTVEIVSPDKPKRDLVDKRRDYAEARIPEYWIVDPRTETVTVLVLQGEAYVEHGVFRRGAQATSVLLDGLTVDVSAVFDAGRLSFPAEMSVIAGSDRREDREDRRCRRGRIPASGPSAATRR